MEFGGPGLKIIVVDNASTDGSVAHLRSKLPQVELIVNDVNIGFAAGCNVGIRRALDAGCDFVYLLNNDAVIVPRTISELVAWSERLKHAAILGSVVRYVEGGGYQFFGSQRTALGQPKWFEFPNDKHLLELSLIETDFVIGAALFVPAKLLRAIGLFDERFYLTYEDVDLCYRAQKEGVRCAVVTSSTVHHHASVSMGPESAPLQTYFLTRNELLFTEKHANYRQRLSVFYFRLRRLCWRMIKALATASLRDLSMRAMILGFRDYLWGRFGDCPDAVRRYAATVRRDLLP